MGFLPPVDPATNPEAAAIFARVKASRGWVSNAMKSMAHAPEGLAVFSVLGHYGRYGTALTEVQRELVILLVGRGVPYAWAHHAPLGLQAGLTEAQVAAIKEGCVPDDLPAADRAVGAYVLSVLAGKGTAPELAAELTRHLTPRQVTDVTLLTTYYLALGTGITALGIEVEPPEVLAIEQAWQRQHIQATAGQGG